jgi:serine/threonine-protein kinase
VIPFFFGAMGEPHERTSRWVGRLLHDKWRIDAQIGRGGVATVFRATHRQGQVAAIKIMHAEYARNEDARRRFLREGYAANKVGHPCVVRVLDDDVAEDGSAYIVMELLGGGELLEDRRERCGGRLPVGEAVAIGDQVLDVLAAAHEKGVIHRDIKPENIYVQADGTVKVLDFGIAHIKEATKQHERTATGLVLGSPEYMSPEQALGKRGHIDAQTDLYALGATLFTLLSGESVHVCDTLAALLVSVSSRQARSLATASFKEIPRDVIAVVDKALELEKHRRWPSARAMQAALRATRAGQSIAPPKTVRLADAPAHPAPAPPARAPAGAPPAPGARPAPPRPGPRPARGPLPAPAANPAPSDPPPSSFQTLVDAPRSPASARVDSSVPPPSEETATYELPAITARDSVATAPVRGALLEPPPVDSEDVPTQNYQPSPADMARAAARGEAKRKSESNPWADEIAHADLDAPTLSTSGPFPASAPLSDGAMPTPRDDRFTPPKSEPEGLEAATVPAPIASAPAPATMRASVAPPPPYAQAYASAPHMAARPSAPPPAQPPHAGPHAPQGAHGATPWTAPMPPMAGMGPNAPASPLGSSASMPPPPFAPHGFHPYPGPPATASPMPSTSTMIAIGAVTLVVFTVLVGSCLILSR